MSFSHHVKHGPFSLPKSLHSRNCSCCSSTKSSSSTTTAVEDPPHPLVLSEKSASLTVASPAIIMSSPHIFNAPAHGIPYFAAAQVPASGTADVPQPDSKPIPKLFQPIKIRGVEFQNRIFVSTRSYIDT